MSASRKQRAATAERRAKCLEMRLGGARWDEIAERLHYAGKAAAYKDFERAMEAAREAQAETATMLKNVELARLDRIQRAFWMRAMSGDHRAGKVVLDVHDRRVRLLDMTGAQRAMDNAVDAWVEHLTGGAAGLDPGDAAALHAVA